MPLLVARQIMVEFKIFAVGKIALAHVPVTCSLHAVYQRAVMQYGQIEAAAVPAHQLRRVFADKAEKFAHHFRFAAVGLAQRSDMHFVVPAQAAGNRHHLLQMVRHKIAAGFGAPLLCGKFHHFVVAHAVGQRMKQADGPHVGNGFNVKNENRRHGAACQKRNMRFWHVAGCFKSIFW